MKFAGDLYRCGDDDVSLMKYQAKCIKPFGVKGYPHPHQPLPRLEHDRWVVTCACRAGVGVSRTGFAVCCECGAQMRVPMPDAELMREVAELMDKRLPVNRNWFPGQEDADQLRLENAQHLS